MVSLSAVVQDILPNPAIQEVPVLVIAFVLTLKVILEVYEKYQNRESSKALKYNGTHDLLINMATKVNDLHHWHNIEDRDGVKIWYIRRSFEDALLRMSANQEKIITLLQEQMADQKQVNKELQYELQKLNS